MDRESCLLYQLTPRNLLSFGPDTGPIQLRPLNVLIGPNGSGKSNFLEAVALLRASSRDLRSRIRSSGGVREWIWKGEPGGEASLEVLVCNPHKLQQPLRHTIVFSESSKAFHLIDESIENERPYRGQESPYFYYRYQRGNPVVNVKEEKEPRRLERESIEPDSSILVQRKDPDTYPDGIVPQEP